MKFMALDTTSLAWRASDETYASASVARCQVSWWSTSATEHSKRARTRSFSPLSTWRLPLSESTSGRCSSTVPRATRAADTPVSPSVALQRAHVVLEAAQRGDGALGGDGVAAAHPDLGAAHDLALGDLRAAHGAELGDHEH